ncbi:hypothetical protein AUG19_06190 [archaeon 13_1_20CM_2_54_9]|nr:MAG: hypothetical protein AUG19_06190 [archaeon 13_1_20CM_2_54_9]TMI27090.1 MAG: hypothetical protein E6H36_04340 [Candidatus Bathyarchaeota archaeon]TMI30761.1 MAG: hypothetical protein E6H29_06975 [Candidatus Bathyarchaeota archaeon]
MALVMKPVSIGKAIYLRVPKDVEELLSLMTVRVCTVDFKIDEKGCSLVYNFAKPISDLTEEPGTRQPLWLEKELLP